MVIIIIIIIFYKSNQVWFTDMLSHNIQNFLQSQNYLPSYIYF